MKNFVEYLGMVLPVGAIVAAIIYMLNTTPPSSRVTEDIQYLYDARTDLCFATRYGGKVAASYVLASVPCTPAVLVLAKDRRP